MRAIDLLELDIIGVAESHLKGNTELSIPGFKWLGQNRLHLHPRARIGSGGVGFLIRSFLLDLFNVTIVDASEESILWIQFTCKTSHAKFNACVCYLPPTGSTRSVDIHEYFDNLLGQVYRYQTGHPFFICGDFNGRIGSSTDYVAGVDEIPDRHVVDFTSNKQGETLIEFLLSSSCCILNGRNHINNDFTCIRPGIGQSVVDYALIPHEQLSYHTNFMVSKSKDLYQSAGCVSTVDPVASAPDHSLIHWSFTLPWFSGTQDNQVPGVVSSAYIRYDFSSMPVSFMNDQSVMDAIQHTIDWLQKDQSDQHSVDCTYMLFQDTLRIEMDNNLPHKLIRVSSGEKRTPHSKKPWWSTDLDLLWQTVKRAEDSWSSASRQSKPDAKIRFRRAQKDFDREVQRSKRRYWRQEQERLLNLHDTNSRNFWKHIGRLGIGEKRVNKIPMEVLRDDGTARKDTATVFSKWKTDFHDLLNPAGVNINIDHHNMTHIPQAVIDPGLNVPITHAEITRALDSAKSGKAPGFDGIHVECLRNSVSVDYLIALFNKCFETGVVPTQWKYGIITPIQKAGMSDKRCPLNYRGITITSSVYKLFCYILSGRIQHWVGVNNLLSDEQNGFRPNRSCMDHVVSLNLVVQSHIKHRKDLYCTFIDFSKAFDRIDRSALWAKLSHMGLHTGRQV